MTDRIGVDEEGKYLYYCDRCLVDYEIPRDSKAATSWQDGHYTAHRWEGWLSVSETRKFAEDVRWYNEKFGGSL